MSQRVLFSILSAVLFAACEDDTIVSLNAVTFTKSHLSDVAESRPPCRRANRYSRRSLSRLL